MKELIAIVEDDPEILHILTFILTTLNYEILEIPEYSDLAEIIAAGPSLIILDEKLDRVLGHDICLALKGNPDTAHIPVILFSAVNDLEKIALACKADGYIAKPFDLDHFVNVVHSLLKR